MTPIYSNASADNYPTYYVLDVADIVEELMANWHAVIVSEIVTHRNHEAEQVFPEVYSINEETGEMVKTVYTAQHHQTRQRPWHPDVSFILNNVICAIKQRNDPSENIEMSLQLMEFDIASMTHNQLMPNIPADTMTVAYSDARMKIARLAGEFGKHFFNHLVMFGLYKDGYFPYHFAGMQDTCVLVELDLTHR